MSWFAVSAIKFHECNSLKGGLKRHCLMYNFLGSGGWCMLASVGPASMTGPSIMALLTSRPRSCPSWLAVHLHTARGAAALRLEAGLGVASHASACLRASP